MTDKAGSEPRGTRVEVNYRWLAVLLSVVPLLVLRGHRTGMVIYAGVLTVAALALLLWLPRKVTEAERKFSRESLRLLALRDFEGLRRLAAGQRLLAHFGRRFLIPETLGLAASAAGEHEEARARYAEALAAAPHEERLRIEVNLASEELATGNLEAAEARYRTVLRRRPDLPLALGNLGRVLVMRGLELAEAIRLLQQALPLADGREAPILRLALAEALIRTHAARDAWESELTRAVEAGADPAAVDRIRALARP